MRKAITRNRSTTAIASTKTAGVAARASGRISRRQAGRHSLITSRADSRSTAASSATMPIGLQMVQANEPVPP
jgi:hypothetical protein